MFKKKIHLTIYFVLIIFSSICFADNSRWSVLQQDSEEFVSLDTERVFLFINQKDPYVDCWVKAELLKDDMTLLEHTYINTNNF